MTDETIRHIDIEYSEASMFGTTDPDDENIDVAASLDAFEEALTAALAEHYPGVEPCFTRGINDTYSAQEADGFPVDADTAFVGHTMGQVHGSWDWLRYNT